MPIYAEFGVSYLWLIDPDIKTLEAYELQDGRWSLLKTLSNDVAVSIAPFDATTFSLADLWA